MLLLRHRLKALGRCRTKYSRLATAPPAACGGRAPTTPSCRSRPLCCQVGPPAAHTLTHVWLARAPHSAHFRTCAPAPLPARAQVLARLRTLLPNAEREQLWVKWTEALRTAPPLRPHPGAPATPGLAAAVHPLAGAWPAAQVGGGGITLRGSGAGKWRLPTEELRRLGAGALHCGEVATAHGRALRDKRGKKEMKGGRVAGWRTAQSRA